ncbi:MAG: hypothetical protein ACSHXK_01960 [Oceanococcus sp.]
MYKIGITLLAVCLSACQGSEYSPASSTQDLNGVWRGSVSDAKGLESMQAHVLDGLLLAVSQDKRRAHSGELVLDDGQLAGILAMRGEAGERGQDYSVLGYADPGDVMEADLLSNQDDGQMSLFYDLARSYQGASYYDVAGLYYLDNLDFQLSLSIDVQGFIEGYDDAGCAYFGQLNIPDAADNIYAVSLDVEGCALDGEYSFGIGSLQYVQGWPQLVLPLWFEQQDRVEAWVLDRV